MWNIGQPWRRVHISQERETEKWVKRIKLSLTMLCICVYICVCICVCFCICICGGEYTGAGARREGEVGQKN